MARWRLARRHQLLLIFVLQFVELERAAGRQSTLRVAKAPMPDDVLRVELLNCSTSSRQSGDELRPRLNPAGQATV